MRLVDADAILQGLRDIYEQEEWASNEVHFSLLDTEMNFCGEVEAVPVIFIEEKIRQYKTDIESWRDKGYGTPMSDTLAIDTLTELISEWRVQNQKETK